MAASEQGAVCMYGALQLLGEDGAEKHKYTIHKQTTTLGRYVARLTQCALQ